jgi:hypothetical protein
MQAGEFRLGEARIETRGAIGHVGTVERLLVYHNPG